MPVVNKLVDWVLINTKGPVQALVSLVMVFPFIVIIIGFLMLIGVISSPMLVELKVHTRGTGALQESMIHINRIAKEYYTLSKRKDGIIEFLVVEDCRQKDNALDPNKCDRLERKLEANGR